jgi:hypothetical protein
MDLSDTSLQVDVPSVYFTLLKFSRFVVWWLKVCEMNKFENIYLTYEFVVVLLKNKSLWD